MLSQSYTAFPACLFTSRSVCLLDWETTCLSACLSLIIAPLQDLAAPARGVMYSPFPLIPNQLYGAAGGHVMSCYVKPLHVASMSCEEMFHRSVKSLRRKALLSAGSEAMARSSHGSDIPTPMAKMWMPCLRASSASGIVCSAFTLDRPSVMTIAARGRKNNRVSQ